MTTTTGKHHQKINFRNLSVFYSSLPSVEQTLSEVFSSLPYHFTAATDHPLIIDAGSNIGIATLFFKQMYPFAHVLCFEPDPTAFQLLEQNIAFNNISDVTQINAALSEDNGETDFFGQIFTDAPDSRGNSIIKTWGLQRTITDAIRVQSVRLSSYIDTEIDFLKLDIEGAEQQVLMELEQAGKLALIKEMSIEVHQSSHIKHINDVEAIVDLLHRNGFALDITETNMTDILPEEVAAWAEKISPKLFIIRAKRIVNDPRSTGFPALVA